MTSASIVVAGDEELSRTLGELAHGLDNLESANRKAAELALAKAGPRTPRRSGALGASGRVDADQNEGVVIYDAVYARVIHDGWPAHNIDAQPWLAETAADQTTALTGVYVDYVEDLVHRVHGV